MVKRISRRHLRARFDHPFCGLRKRSWPPENELTEDCAEHGVRGADVTVFAESGRI